MAAYVRDDVGEYTIEGKGTGEETAWKVSRANEANISADWRPVKMCPNL